jgi:hypothetical protein
MATVFALVLASLVLAACGSSSKSSSSTSTSASASASSKTATGGPAGAGGKRFTALRECLEKEGITLPKPTGGQHKPGKGGPGGAAGFLGGGGGAGGRQLPKGVSKSKYEAAIKKCGGSPAGGHFKRGGSNFAGPTAKAALAKFAACMRENGVNVPAPNTSGKGPVFNTKGLNTSSSKFKTAETKCASILRAAYNPSEGAGGGQPPSSAG